MTSTLDAQRMVERQLVPCGEQSNNDNRGEVRRTSVSSPISRGPTLITFGMAYPINILTILTTFKAPPLLHHYGRRREVWVCVCGRARAQTHTHADTVLYV